MLPRIFEGLISHPVCPADQAPDQQPSYATPIVVLGCSALALVGYAYAKVCARRAAREPMYEEYVHVPQEPNPEELDPIQLATEILPGIHLGGFRAFLTAEPKEWTMISCMSRTPHKGV